MTVEEVKSHINKSSTTKKHMLIKLKNGEVVTKPCCTFLCNNQKKLMVILYKSLKSIAGIRVISYDDIESIDHVDKKQGGFIS